MSTAAPEEDPMSSHSALPDGTDGNHQPSVAVPGSSDDRDDARLSERDSSLPSAPGEDERPAQSPATAGAQDGPATSTSFRAAYVSEEDDASEVAPPSVAPSEQTLIEQVDEHAPRVVDWEQFLRFTAGPGSGPRGIIRATWTRTRPSVWRMLLETATLTGMGTICGIAIGSAIAAWYDAKTPTSLTHIPPLTGWERFETRVSAHPTGATESLAWLRLRDPKSESQEYNCSLTVSDSAAGPGAFTLDEEKGVARVSGHKRRSRWWLFWRGGGALDRRWAYVDEVYSCTTATRGRWRVRGVFESAGQIDLASRWFFRNQDEPEELLSRVAMSAGTGLKAPSGAEDRARTDEHDEEAAHVGPEGEFELHLSGKYSTDMTPDELALLPAFLVKAGTACPGYSKDSSSTTRPGSSNGRKASDNGAGYMGRQEL